MEEQRNNIFWGFMPRDYNWEDLEQHFSSVCEVTTFLNGI
jgi:hypothetical protein